MTCACGQASLEAGGACLVLTCLAAGRTECGGSLADAHSIRRAIVSCRTAGVNSSPRNGAERRPHVEMRFVCLPLEKEKAKELGLKWHDWHAAAQVSVDMFGILLREGRLTEEDIKMVEKKDPIFTSTIYSARKAPEKKRLAKAEWTILKNGKMLNSIFPKRGKAETAKVEAFIARKEAEEDASFQRRQAEITAAAEARTKAGVIHSGAFCHEEADGSDGFRL